MFRYLLRTGHIARTSSFGVCERSLVLSKCNKPAVFRLSNRGELKPLSTCSARLCEKKDHAVLSNIDDKAQGDKKDELAESLSVAAPKVVDAQKDHVVLSNQNENINADKKDESAESLTVAAQKVEDAQKDHVVLSDQSENMHADKKDESAESLTLAAQKVEDSLKDHAVLSEQNENIHTDKRAELAESLTVAAPKVEDAQKDNVVLSDQTEIINADKKEELGESLTVAAPISQENNTDHVILSNHDEKINQNNEESAESLTVAAPKGEENNTDHVILSNHDEKINLDNKEESAEISIVAAQEAEDAQKDDVVLSDHDMTTNPDKQDESLESLTLAAQETEDKILDHEVISDHDVKINADEKDESTESSTVAAQKSEDENLDHAVLSDHAENINLGKQVDPTETPKGEDEVLIMAEPKEEPVVLKTEDGGSAQQQVDVEMKQNVSSPEQAQPKAPKSGKESLLDLLSSMKVHVVSKKKKEKQGKAPIPKSQPVAVESPISMFEESTAAVTAEESLQGETLDPQLVSAASAAAAALPNVLEAKSELLKQLRRQESISQAQSTGQQNNLTELIADMKVTKTLERNSPRPIGSASDENRRRFKSDGGITAELSDVRRRILYKGNGLGIFSPPTDEASVESAVARPTLWDMDFALKLSEAVDHKAQNGLEEMIQWTKEGKMWEYPVNNEAGMEEESEVPFHEHIFLEEHLKEGFPQKGPVRHFMELVVAGLSKNPYLTVQQKTEHISWFRDYFEQKEDVLKEAGVHLK